MTGGSYLSREELPAIVESCKLASVTDQEKAAPPSDWAMAEAAKIVQDITHAQIDSIVGEIEGGSLKGCVNE